MTGGADPSVRRRTECPACRMHHRGMRTAPTSKLAGVPSAPDLAAWDAEGGASDDPVHTPENAAATLSAEEYLQLARLGAALVGEWNNLPMPVRRAIYDRAVRGEPGGDISVLKRRMARFLHDRKGLRQPGIAPYAPRSVA